MSDGSSIEWTDASWNPTRGCSRISPGCERCYAERTAARFVGGTYAGLVRLGKNGPRWTGRVMLVPDKLDEPLGWRRPRRIFVNSMSDLFHESLADDDIDRVMAVIALAPRHTFQVLTKRAARMRAYMSAPGLYERVLRRVGEVRTRRGKVGRDGIVTLAHTDIGVSNPTTWRHLWLGVSVEDQQRADERIPHLLATPAAVRWLSVEPLLGPVNLTRVDAARAGWRSACSDEAPIISAFARWQEHPMRAKLADGVDWVVVGAESGRGARPMDEAWVRALRDQCVGAGVAFFYKQRLEGKRKVPLPTLDGRQWMEFPR